MQSFQQENKHYSAQEGVSGESEQRRLTTTGTCANSLLKYTSARYELHLQRQTVCTSERRQLEAPRPSAHASRISARCQRGALKPRLLARSHIWKAHLAVRALDAGGCNRCGRELIYLGQFALIVASKIHTFSAVTHQTGSLSARHGALVSHFDARKTLCSRVRYRYWVASVVRLTRSDDFQISAMSSSVFSLKNMVQCCQ